MPVSKLLRRFLILTLLREGLSLLLIRVQAILKLSLVIAGTSPVMT
jgi:hypothetical protein